MSTGTNIDKIPKPVYLFKDLSDDSTSIIVVGVISHLQHIGSEGVLAIDQEKHPKLMNQLTIADQR